MFAYTAVVGAVRKWKSAVTISKARTYRAVFCTARVLLPSRTSVLDGNNVLTIYRCPILSPVLGDRVGFMLSANLKVCHHEVARLLLCHHEVVVATEGSAFDFSSHYPLFTTHCFQIPHQPPKRRLIRIVFLPPAEVRNEILPHLPRRVFPRIAVEALPIAQPLKPHQPDGKQHPLAFFRLPFARLGNLGLHPLARHAVLRQDQQQPVMQPNGLVDLLV